MRRLLLFVTIWQIVICQCPSGLDLVSGGECRGNYSRVDSYWDQLTDSAINKCNEIHAEPVIIHNEEQQSYWVDWCSRTNPNHYVIGLVCNSKTKKWEWSDGSAVDYKPPKYSPELDQACTTGCSWTIYQISATYTWYYYCKHDTQPSDIFCTKQLQPLPALNGADCDVFENDSEDGVCYQVGEAAENWQDAQMSCKHLGANLASIHNQQENSFVRRLAVSKGAVAGVYLGGTLSGKGKEFGWVDGSAWDFQNFHAGFPIPSAGSCLAMDTSTPAGLWMNNDCSQQLPVACIREQRNITVPVATCSDGPWEEGSVITSPGFPYNASMPCEYFLAVDVGKKVELEILLLEANSCCDSVMLYDGFLGGNIIANLTGAIHNATYTSSLENTMRVVWQPNGGVNVKGLAMTFRGV